MPTPSWTVSFTTPTASNSPAKACAGHEANRTRRLDQTSAPVTQSLRLARLATRAASFRYGGRHHSGIPGAIIPLYPGDFVGIRRRSMLSLATARRFRDDGWDHGGEIGPQSPYRSYAVTAPRGRHSPDNPRSQPLTRRSDLR